MSGLKKETPVFGWYLVSMLVGAKSILCLVWKTMVLVRISMTEGGNRGVAMAKRANWGWLAVPPSLI